MYAGRKIIAIINPLRHFPTFFIHCCITTPKHNKGETEIFYNKTNHDFSIPFKAAILTHRLKRLVLQNVNLHPTNIFAAKIKIRLFSICPKTKRIT